MSQLARRFETALTRGCRCREAPAPRRRYRFDQFGSGALGTVAINSSPRQPDLGPIRAGMHKCRVNGFAAIETNPPAHTSETPLSKDMQQSSRALARSKAIFADRVAAL